MDTRTVVRHIVGYVVGITVFFICFPAILYCIAICTNPYITISIIDDVRIRFAISLVLLAVGLTFSLWSNIALLLIGKGGPTEAFGVSISPPTKHLVVKGPYKYTRNPMVFGALTCYIAVALYLNSPVAIAAIVACVPLILIYLKHTEEKRLERDFGDEFREYRKNVSMLIPLPPKK